MDLNIYKLKQRMSTFEDMIKVVDGLNELTDYRNDFIFEIKRKISYAEEFAEKFIQSNRDNIEYTGVKEQKQKEFKELTECFDVLSSLSKTIGTSINYYSKINKIQKQIDNDNISSTQALIETGNILYSFKNSIKENKNFDILCSTDSFSKLFECTQEKIINTYNQLLKSPDIDFNKFQSEINKNSIEPDDSFILDRIENNKIAIQQINAVPDVNEDEYLKKKQDEIEFLYEDSIISFDRLVESMNYMISSGKYSFREMNSLALTLCENLESLYDEQFKVKQSIEQGSVIDNIIETNHNGMLYDLDNYTYEILNSTVQNISEIAVENNIEDSEFLHIANEAISIMSGYGSEASFDLRKIIANHISDCVKQYDDRILPKTETQNKEQNETANDEIIRDDQSDITNQEQNNNELGNSTITNQEENQTTNENTLTDENVNYNYSVQQEETERIVEKFNEKAKQPENTELEPEEQNNPENDNGLSEEDSRILDEMIGELRKYEWVKHTLLYNTEFNISDNLKSALASDTLKDKIEKKCQEQPEFEYEGELPFTKSEEQEIRNIIENLCEKGCPKDEIAKITVSQIQNSASEGLKETWQTLSNRFNGSYKYFYLARDYIKDVYDEVSQTLAKEDDGMVMSRN